MIVCMHFYCTYLPCNYKEQEGNKYHYMKQEYLSPIFKQKLQ